MSGLLLLGIIAWVCRPSRPEGLLLSCAGALLLLLTPIPWFNSFLWRAVPQAVRDITNNAPLSRFCVIIAALTVTATAGFVAKLGAKRFACRAIGAALLAIGVNWSLGEACTFVFREPQNASAVPSHEPSLDPNNILNPGKVVAV